MPTAVSTSNSEALRRVLLRAVALTVLLAVEYLLLALRFDGLLFRYEGWWQELAHLVTFAAVSATGVLVLSGGEVLNELREQSATNELPSLTPGLAAHALAVVAMFLLAAYIEQNEWTQWGFGSMAAALGLCALASVLAAMLAIFPWSALLTLVAHLRIALLVGAVAGVLAYVAGILTSFLWRPLAGLSLSLAARGLFAIADDVIVVPDQYILGMGTLTVRVAKECSGLEGMGLMLIFSSAYLWQNRKNFEFPRALVLVPLSIVGIYAANLVRIIALTYIGARYSEAIALGGFHSKAGWVFFCAVSLGIVWLGARWEFIQSASHPSRLVHHVEQHGASPTSVFLMPLIAVIGTSLLTGLVSITRLDPFYGLRVLAVALVLYVYRKELLALPRQLSWFGAIMGVVVFVMWILMVPEPTELQHTAMHAAILTMGDTEGTAWLVLRVLGATFTVPIAEELAFRGFLMRRFIAAEFEHVPFTRISTVALGASSLLFGLLHQGQVVAGILAGLAYGLTMLRKGSIGDAMLAHGITNALLAAYAIAFDRWGYL